MLASRVDDSEVRAIVAAALRPSNSTSVHLLAVQTLGAEVEEADGRKALIQTFDSEYSTSVTLRTMEALDGQVDNEPDVKDAYIRLMRDDSISSTARVRAGGRLLPGADERLRGIIVEAMEDVVIRLSQHGRRGHSDALDDALEIIESVDSERGGRLRERYRSGDEFAGVGGAYSALLKPQVLF